MDDQALDTLAYISRLPHVSIREANFNLGIQVLYFTKYLMKIVGINPLTVKFFMKIA